LDLRILAVTLVFKKVSVTTVGAKSDPRAAAEGLAILMQSLVGRYGDKQATRFWQVGDVQSSVAEPYLRGYVAADFPH